jgi:hypothetical protein
MNNDVDNATINHEARFRVAGRKQTVEMYYQHERNKCCSSEKL